MKKVIYTAIINNYDLLKEPLKITSGWEYVCFSNDKTLKSKYWDIRYIEDSNPKKARELKIVSPFRETHDIYIWIDASMAINCDLDDYVKKYTFHKFTLLRHPHRNCIYDEARVCIKRKKDSAEVINNQIDKYIRSGYPKNAGMVATGVLVRSKDKAVDNFCDQWWSEVKNNSIRDQLSFNYTHYNNPILYHLSPFEVLDSEFILTKHFKNGFRYI